MQCMSCKARTNSGSNQRRRCTFQLHLAGRHLKAAAVALHNAERRPHRPSHWRRILFAQLLLIALLLRTHNAARSDDCCHHSADRGLFSLSRRSTMCSPLVHCGGHLQRENGARREVAQAQANYRALSASMAADPSLADPSGSDCSASAASVPSWTSLLEQISKRPRRSPRFSSDRRPGCRRAAAGDAVSGH